MDHGDMQKGYGKSIHYPTNAYSPPRIIGAYKSLRHGDMYQQGRICTSHVARMNGSIRTFCKRMGRLTYSFSNKWGNHRAALAIMFCHYNYNCCRQHATLKGHTPARAHGLTTEVSTVRKMLEMVVAN